MCLNMRQITVWHLPITRTNLLAALSILLFLRVAAALCSDRFGWGSLCCRFLDTADLKGCHCHGGAEHLSTPRCCSAAPSAATHLSYLAPKIVILHCSL